MTGRRVFVTGGNGFLGSLLVQRLVEQDAEVTCLIKEERPLSRFHTDRLSERVTCVRGVMEDFGLLCEILPSKRIDTVFHLAAQPIIGEAKRDPLPMFESNVRGMYNMLEAARRWGRLRAFVSVTSDKSYGEGEHLPYVETDRLLGIAPYDASKVCADVLSQSYARSYGLPVGIARMGNLYGPGDIQWSRVVPGIVRSLLAGERPIIRSDGRMQRDYFFIEDAVEGLLVLGAALDRPEIRGEAFNFGTGIPTSVLEIVRALISRSGLDIAPVIQNEAVGEISAQYLDCAKAKRLLGWVPRTPLDAGLDFAWGWYKQVLT